MSNTTQPQSTEPSPPKRPEPTWAGMMRERHEPLTRLYQVEPAAALIRDGARTAPGNTGRYDPIHGELLVGTSNPARVPMSIHSAVGGDHDGPNPGDYLAAALCGCVDSTLRIIADRLGIVLEDVEVAVSADIDVRGTLRVDPEVAVGFQRMGVNVRVRPAPGTSERMLRILLDATEASCVTLHTLRNGVAIDIASSTAEAHAPTPVEAESTRS
jgi:uncharacterized OsmC-like protein